MLKLLKHILFGNFWSFLLILSGIVDIVIGLFVLTDLISVRNYSTLLFIICLIIGLVYITAGLVIALVSIRKKPV